jgi:hypothetical protein
MTLQKYVEQIRDSMNDVLQVWEQNNRWKKVLP